MKIEITPKELIDFMQQIQNQHIAIRPATIQIADIAPVPPWDEMRKENGCAGDKIK